MIDPLDERDVASFLERAVDAGHDPLPPQPFEEIAQHWRLLGLRPGDVVLLALPTGVALLQHFFGLLAAGGVPALLAPGAPSARLRETARAFGARAVGAVRLPADSLRAVPAERTLATLDDTSPRSFPTLPPPDRVDVIGGIEVAWLAGQAPPAAARGEVVLLTSGTSGSASGCVTTLAAMLRNGARHADSIGQRHGDAVLVSLPLHFSFALVAQALGTLQREGTLIIAGPPFNVDTYATLITSHGVTVSALTPVQVRALLQRPSTAFPEGLRVLSVGGDSLAPAHVAELLRRRPGGELYLTYGLTQAGPRVSTLAAHAEPPSRHGSVGKPIEGTQVTLADLGDGSGRRELHVVSDTLMLRRIGVVEGRRGDDFCARGVLATGDVFDQDEDGYLYYRGRLSEYIMRGGEKVSLATVRRVATQLPCVVAARTRVERRGDDEDFELSLAVTDSPERPTADQYRALLARSVRRSELPRAIHIIVDHPAHAFGYK
jgi:long-chain acyl-CoA synthetase